MGRWGPTWGTRLWLVRIVPFGHVFLACLLPGEKTRACPELAGGDLRCALLKAQKPKVAGLLWSFLVFAGSVTK